MSQRGKRQPNRTDDGPAPTKRRKCRPTPTPTPAEDEEVAALAATPATAADDAAAATQTGTGWTPKPLNDLKISSIYNRCASEVPAEGLRPDTARPAARLPSFSPAVGFPLHSVTLFRKDLISAMKLPDSEPLSPDEYWIITDQWKQEWERGVQVPVNPDSLPEAMVTVNQCPNNRILQDFKLPKSKYIRITKDEFFTNEEHFLSNTPAKAEKACSYDLDDCDATWLQIVNGERALMGPVPKVLSNQRMKPENDETLMKSDMISKVRRMLVEE